MYWTSTIESFTKWLDIVLKDRTTAESPGIKWDKVTDRFAPGGTISVHRMGGWEIARYNKPMDVKVTFVPFPKAKYATPDQDWGEDIGIGKGSKHIEEAWTFLKWMDEDNRYNFWYPRLPTAAKDAGAWAKQVFKEVPYIRAEVLASSVAIARTPDPLLRHPRWAEIEDKILNPGWKDVMEQKIEVADWLKQVKPKLQAIVDEYEKSKK